MSLITAKLSLPDDAHLNAHVGSSDSTSSAASSCDTASFFFYCFGVVLLLLLLFFLRLAVLQYLLGGEGEILELVLVDLRDHSVLDGSEDCFFAREVRVEIVHVLTGFLFREKKLKERENKQRMVRGRGCR